MTPTPRTSDTRQHLIQVAAERFAARGYHGTSFRDLIAASGMSKGAFYFHFPSKLDLALATYREKQRELIQASLSAAQASRSPVERFFLVLETRARVFAADRSFRCLPRLSTDFARDPELKTRVTDLHGHAIEMIERLLEDAIEAGEVRPTIDPRPAARTIFATIVGLDEVSERETGGADLLERSREFRTLLRLALIPHPPTTPPTPLPEED